MTKARQNSSASWGSNGGDPRPGGVGGEGHLVGEEGPARQVERHLDQRLVERAAASRRTAAPRPCRPGPRPGSRRARCPRPPPCGGRRRPGRPRPRRSGRSRRAGPAARACGRRTAGRSTTDDRAGAVEVERHLDRRLLGRAPRRSARSARSAVAVSPPWPAVRATQRQGVEEPVVLRRRARPSPAGTRQAGPARAVAHQDRPGRPGPAHTVVGRRGRAAGRG